MCEPGLPLCRAVEERLWWALPPHHSTDEHFGSRCAPRENALVWLTLRNLRCLAFKKPFCILYNKINTGHWISVGFPGQVVNQRLLKAVLSWRKANFMSSRRKNDNGPRENLISPQFCFSWPIGVGFLFILVLRKVNPDFVWDQFLQKEQPQSNQGPFFSWDQITPRGWLSLIQHQQPNLPTPGDVWEAPPREGKWFTKPKTAGISLKLHFRWQQTWPFWALLVLTLTAPPPPPPPPLYKRLSKLHSIRVCLNPVQCTVFFPRKAAFTICDTNQVKQDLRSAIDWQKTEVKKGFVIVKSRWSSQIDWVHALWTLRRAQKYCIHKNWSFYTRKYKVYSMEKYPGQ